MTEVLGNISEILNSIQKNLKAPKNKQNKFGNFPYRNAEGILEAYKEEIKKEQYPNHLTQTNSFSLEAINGRLFMKCVSCIEVTGGQKKEADGYAELDLNKKGMDQSQLSGAVTSYAKKYALCNLFAIDDSKDDPDSDEEPKDEVKAQVRNGSGLSKDGDLAGGEDMKETLNKKNEEDFKGLKSIIENCAGLDELQEIWKEKKNAKILTSLLKWRPELYKLLTDAKDEMKKSFE